MGVKWVNEDQKKRIAVMYETTYMTMEQIADELDITRKQVHRFVHNNYSKEFRDARKRDNYRRSKMGVNNPMSGKYGSSHHNYVGEVGDGRGYLMVLKPDWYTGRKGSKHVFKHTVVMCEHLGLTELPAGFIVHHIDGDTKNNDIDNLALISNSGHLRLHARERATTISKGSRAQGSSKRTARVANVSGS